MSIDGDDRVFTPEEFDAHLAAIPPADPPWLGEVIVDATRGVHDEDCSEGPDCVSLRRGLEGGRYSRWAEAAIRAALPVIAAGVLNAEADALLAEIRLQSSWLWYELGETAIEKLAKRLRERAARQVTG
jgi:hypothetical protein